MGVVNLDDCLSSSSLPPSGGRRCGPANVGANLYKMDCACNKLERRSVPLLAGGVVGVLDLGRCRQREPGECKCSRRMIDAKAGR